MPIEEGCLLIDLLAVFSVVFDACAYAYLLHCVLPRADHFVDVHMVEKALVVIEDWLPERIDSCHAQCFVHCEAEEGRVVRYLL